MRKELLSIVFEGENRPLLDRITAPLFKDGKVVDSDQWNKAVDDAAALLLNLPQSEMPVTRRFCDGQYLQEVVIPAGTLAIGHGHTSRFFDIVLRGKALVVMNGEVKEICAPCVLVSEPNARKVGIILEEIQWITVHPTNETDPDKLDEMLLVKSPILSRYQEATNPEKIARDRADYLLAIEELGFSHDQVIAMTEDTEDQIQLMDASTNGIMFLPSKIEGIGMFAVRSFAKGDDVIVARRGDKRTQAGRFTNHSATPNAIAKLMPNGTMLFEATEYIHVGIEITVDYRHARMEALKQL